MMIRRVSFCWYKKLVESLERKSCPKDFQSVLSYFGKLIYGLILLAVGTSGCVGSPNEYTQPDPPKDRRASYTFQNKFGGITKIFFFDDKTGWVVGEDGMIIATDDRGQTWQSQKSGTSKELSSVWFVDSLTGWVTGDSGTIISTHDGGETWHPQKSGTSKQLSSVCFVDSLSGWAVGGNGTIISTHDGGKAWHPQKSGTLRRFSSLCFVDNLTGWAVGDYGSIISTHDGGETWHTRKSGTSNWLSSLCFVDSLTGWVAGDYGMIIFTHDGGKTWHPQKSGISKSLSSVCFVDSLTGWAVGDYGSIISTHDGGKTWHPQKSEISKLLSSVCFVDSLTGWAVGENGTMIATYDGGVKWNLKQYGTSEVLYSVDFVNHQTGWAVGDNGSVITTNDGGATWWPQTSETSVDLKSVCFVDRLIGWAVGNRGTIIVTKNGGDTWKPQSKVTSANLNSVYFVVDSPIGWVVGDSGTIIVTTNGGDTWKPQARVTSANLNSVCFADRQTGWVVGDSGTVVATTNAGRNWDLQPRKTSSDLYSVYFADRLRGWAVGSHGTAIGTKNGGKNWDIQETWADNLRSVHFVDSLTGWAVGENRMVFSTNDGGNMWYRQSLEWELDENFYAVYFIDASSGWVAGKELLKCERVNQSPYVDTFKTIDKEKNIIVRWHITDDQPSDSIKDRLLYFHRDVKGSWDRLDTGYSIGNGWFEFSWDPSASPYRIVNGTDIYYGIGSTDGFGLSYFHELNKPFTYNPWSNRLTPLEKRMLAFVGLLLGYIVLCGSLILVKPIWLLRFYEMLQFSKYADKASLGGILLAFIAHLMVLLLFVRSTRVRSAWISYYRSHPGALAQLSPEIKKDYICDKRCLDAWVETRITQANKGFRRIADVQERSVYIPMPIEVLRAEGDKVILPCPEVKDFKSYFPQDRQVVTIVGEGGVGKSTLAFELARLAMGNPQEERLANHLMIPILVAEETLDLKTRIGGFLKELIGHEEVDEDIVSNLLMTGRLLLIVDGLSERSSEMNICVERAFGNLNLKFMIVTSRRPLQFGAVETTTLYPKTVRSDHLAHFIDNYLVHHKVREKFTDDEFFDACKRLTLMVGDREITILFAKLYADQLILVKKGESDLELPKTIPDLMLRYLNDINRYTGEDDPDDRTVHRLAKVISWECLKKTFRPAEANLDEVLNALQGDENAERHLRYLEVRLRLIQIVNEGKDKVRMSLDPIAEYLAGLHLIALYGSEEAQWRDFLETADKMPGAPEDIKGFILAVRDCVLAKGKNTGVPRFMVDELGKRAGLDHEASE
jgi:photosystem II stability/assembly factor-like uncharacterized protein